MTPTSRTTEPTAAETAAPTQNSFLTDVWVNYARWNVKAIRNPFVIAEAVIQPIVFLVLFSEVFGGVASSVVGGSTGEVNYVTFLLPAIAIQVGLLAAAASGIGLVDDIERGMFNKVLVTPMRRSAVFLGKALSELTRIAIQVAVVLVVGYLLGARIATGLPGAAGIVAITLLFSVWFTAFSNIVAIRTGNIESTIIATNFLTLPLLFVSSAFLPVESLPGWIQLIAMVNPITYGVDAARALMIQGWAWDVMLPAMGVLVALDLIVGAIAVRALNRASSAEVQ